MSDDQGRDIHEHDLVPDDVSDDDAGQNDSSSNDDVSHDSGGHVATPDEPAVDHNDLFEVKQQALQQLAPLVKHLDQSGEERFNTLMMMLRASDDAAYVRPAYEAAQDIEDEAKRAQALLDVVNEVNYLTRPQHNHDDKP